MKKKKKTNKRIELLKINKKLTLSLFKDSKIRKKEKKMIQSER